MDVFCNDCPRQCGAKRGPIEPGGVCRSPALPRVSRAAPHFGEEPCISGVRGSGTVFFTGCNLRCVFCQNREISRGGGTGEILSVPALRDLMLRLRDQGVHNINLVTGAHFIRPIAEALQGLDLGIPVVWNSGGYESVETLRLLEGLVDIYLPDCKYLDAELSARCSRAPDYAEVCFAALPEMLRQVGRPRYAPDGTLCGGMILRHLILPGCRADSMNLLRALASRFGTDAFLLSLMSQYTPDFAVDADLAPAPGSSLCQQDHLARALHRKITTFEADSVLSLAADLGFSGFSQSRSSASPSFTPEFE